MISETLYITVGGDGNIYRQRNGQKNEQTDRWAVDTNNKYG